jgi:ABC-type sugar transport system substrate-binding protein
MQHPQWPGVRGGAERFFANVPSLRYYCLAPPEENAASLRTTVERALDWHPNVVCLFIANADTARPTINLLARRSLLLVTMGAAPADARVAGQVGVDRAASAELLGANLAQVAAGRKSYLLIHNAARGEADRNCYLRFSAAAEHQYDVTLLQAVDGTAGDRTATQLVEDLLGLFSHAGLIVTLSPDVWLSAQPGWHHRLHGLNADFRFATLSAAPRLWQHLGTPERPGDAAALVGPLDGEIGYAAAQLGTQLLISTEKPASKITIPCELVTAENLPDFARRYSEAANGLDVSEYLPTR